MTRVWTTPGDIEAKIRRRWDDGRMLAARLKGESLFPLTLSISHPDSKDMLDRFHDVQVWHKDMEAGSKAGRGFGYEITWTESNHRQIGRNRIATSVVIPSEEDALKLIGKLRDSRRFLTLSNKTLATFPGLGDWLLNKPLKLIETSDRWERILAVLAWFQENPRPGIYLRQMDIPGVDTKFIEGCKGLLTELLEILVLEEKPETAFTSLDTFETRFGFRSKPPLIRFRILDERFLIQGLSDIAAPPDQIARLSIPVKRVFITENDINGLSFPEVRESLVIFGLGYGVESLSKIPWLQDKAIHYWGDIDTHGFAMLNRLRLSFPRARSLLMDRATLMAHKALWVEERVPSETKPDRLTPEEQGLFEDLFFDRLGTRVRLEQERIGFRWVERALSGLTE